ncbi:glycosyltransferase [Staphylococcus equorum]|uniref:glycosyltransferase n=1 Tax=Staphylococcus equorum TaxID=246432 RepID=UPI002DB76F74|nr:glycosyltransferase [Staphylococcus equorum]MEB7847918.1 glycosyltransferase [Staphylococcus equorum]
MKLLFVVNNFNFGGPQKSLVNLLYELEEQDVEVDLMIMNQQDKLSEYLPRYVNVIPLPDKYSLLMLDKNNLLSKMLKNFKKPILNIKVLLFIIKSQLKLHDNTKSKQKFWLKNKWKSNEFSGRYDYAIGVSGGHSIYFINDYIKAENKIGWIRTDYKVLKRDNDLDQKYFEYMNGMLAVSNMTANSFNELFGIQPFVFYNSLPIKLYENIEEDKFNYNPNATNLCTICRLDEGKGLDLLIDAAKCLKEDELNIKWYVVGTGKLEKWLHEEIHKNDLSQIVIPLGFKFNTGSLLKKMDVLIHPSRFEGKSNTIDEALFYQKPVIATNFETVYEQIEDGQNGFIVNMNGKEIAESIKNLYENKTLYFEIKNNLENSQNSQLNKGEEFLKLIHKIGDEK